MPRGALRLTARGCGSSASVVCVEPGSVARSVNTNTMLPERCVRTRLPCYGFWRIFLHTRKLGRALVLQQRCVVFLRAYVSPIVRHSGSAHGSRTPCMCRVNPPFRSRCGGCCRFEYIYTSRAGRATFVFVMFLQNHLEGLGLRFWRQCYWACSACADLKFVPIRFDFVGKLRKNIFPVKYH